MHVQAFVNSYSIFYYGIVKSTGAVGFRRAGVYTNLTRRASSSFHITYFS
nr:MAG TPA: hypothetical protein [Caudoviricetes sp.]